MEILVLDDLIRETTHKSKVIKAHYEVYRNFQLENPWIVDDMIRNIKISQPSQAHDLNFDKIVSFKSEYFIDNYSKIYKQLVNRNPLLVNSKKNIVLFYAIEEGLYERQLKAGYRLGDKDELGRIVTGSELVLNSINIDIDDFLNIYYSASN